MIRNVLKRLGLYERSDIEMNGSVYMQRWRFLPDWMPGFRVHKIMRSDEDRELHNHPFGFISVILKGGYFEFTEDGKKRWYGPGSVVLRPADTFHRIELGLHPYSAEDDYAAVTVPAWTLVFRTSYFQQWGFKMNDGSFVHWKDFVAQRKAENLQATVDTGKFTTIFDIKSKFRAPSSV